MSVIWGKLPSLTLSSVPNQTQLFWFHPGPKKDQIQSAHLIPLAFMHEWTKNQLDKRSIGRCMKKIVYDGQQMLF